MLPLKKGHSMLYYSVCMNLMSQIIIMFLNFYPQLWFVLLRKRSNICMKTQFIFDSSNIYIPLLFQQKNIWGNIDLYHLPGSFSCLIYTKLFTPINLTKTYKKNFRFYKFLENYCPLNADKIKRSKLYYFFFCEVWGIRFFIFSPSIVCRSREWIDLIYYKSKEMIKSY